MRKIIVLTALATLAACSGKSDDKMADEKMAPVADSAAAPSAPAAATEQGVAPGTYEVKLADGVKSTTVIYADGTYLDTNPQGKEVHGTYARRDGKDCFDPDGVPGELCWSVSPAGPDGSFTATTPDGVTTVTVTPQTT